LSELSRTELAILFNKSHLFKIAQQNLCVVGENKRKNKPVAKSRQRKRKFEREFAELSLQEAKKNRKEKKKERRERESRIGKMRIQI
jgi:hypothetical protein